MQLILTPELILEAYRHGLFPMAHSAAARTVQWVCPDQRGLLPIDTLHIPRRLLKTLKQTPFDIRIDTAFEELITRCGKATEDRPETWINDEIKAVFCRLHETGHAHSVEVWDNDRLIGGLYGLHIGSVFFGESMFSRTRDASKIALVHLAARLWCGGFTLLDTQFINNHLKQFGAYETPHEEYMTELEDALEITADFKLEGLTQTEILNRYLDGREKDTMTPEEER